MLFKIVGKRRSQTDANVRRYTLCRYQRDSTSQYCTNITEWHTPSCSSNVKLPAYGPAGSFDRYFVLLSRASTQGVDRLATYHSDNMITSGRDSGQQQLPQMSDSLSLIGYSFSLLGYSSPMIGYNCQKNYVVSKLITQSLGRKR